MRRRQAPSPPPPTAPLDDDDLLSVILLRLPPQPSSLPRASTVCKRWRSLASDPGFSRRFRRHHRRNPTLLGCYMRDANELRFEPTLEPPNRISQGRFPFPIDAGDRNFMVLGCRHGFLLIIHTSQGTLKILVWDPVNGHEHLLAIPPGFGEETPINGAVLRAAVGDIQNFQVVLLGTDLDQRMIACVYSSETGVWGNLITTPIPPDVSDTSPAAVDPCIPIVRVGDSLYILRFGKSSSILEFDVHRQSLPVGLNPRLNRHYSVMRAEGGGLGLLFLSTSDRSAQLWKRKTDCDGVASWALGRTIQLDNLLSVELHNRWGLQIQGFAEENNVVFLWAFGDVFMVQLDSLQFKKLPKINTRRWYPLEGVYAAGEMLPSMAAVLEDGNLVSEILLRLPPQPSSLPRASAVCKSLRNVASDPCFSRRFRIHHRRNRPLLGCFMRGGNELRFEPTLDPPNLVPQGRFPFPIDASDRSFKLLGCRHGFLLMLHTFQGTVELLVWDPFNGHEHRLAIPPLLAISGKKRRINGAMLCAAPGVGDIDHFQVLLVSTDVEQGVVACVYSSETGVWGNLITTPLPSPGVIDPSKSAVLVGDSLYMLLLGLGGPSRIIQFDVGRQSLAVIPLPTCLDSEFSRFYSVMRADGGGLGLVFVSTSVGSAQLWKRITDYDGVASWMLRRTIELDKLISPDLKSKCFLQITGLAEENNVVFLWSFVSVFMVQLDSLQFKRLPEINLRHWHPFESVYAAGI